MNSCCGWCGKNLTEFKQFYFCGKCNKSYPKKNFLSAETESSFLQLNNLKFKVTLNAKEELANGVDVFDPRWLRKEDEWVFAGKG